MLVICLSILLAQTELEELSLEELLGVEVVSPAQKVLRITESPAVIRVITAQEIEEKGYRSVGEAVLSIPGIYNAYDNINYNISVRGVSGGMRGWNRIIKVMIDNQPVQFLYNSVNFLGPELIPIEVVQRIEVVLGTGSTLYGYDAFLGIINVVTKEGRHLEGLMLSAKTGTENSKNPYAGISASYGNEFEKVSIIGSISGISSNRSGYSVSQTSPYLDVYRTDISEEDMSKPISGFGKVGLDMGKKGSLQLSISYQRLDNCAKFSDWGVMTQNNRYSLQNYIVRLKYENSFKNDIYLTSFLAYRGGQPTSDDRLDYGSDILTVRRNMGFSGVDFGTQIEYSPSNVISVAIGGNLNFRGFDIENDLFVFTRDFGTHREGDVVSLSDEKGDTSFSDAGIYTQAIYKPTERLSFTQGAIYHYHNIYGDFLDFRFGSVLKFSEEGHCKFLIGTSSNVPPPSYLFNTPIYAGDAVGNTNLKPEHARTFDLEITPINTENFGISFDAFYNLIDQKISFEHREGILKAVNSDNLRVIGVEGSLRWSYSNISSSWSVSYQHTEKRSSDDIAESFNLVETPSFAAPNVMSYSTVSYSIPPIRTVLNFEQKYVGERNATQPNIALNSGNIYKLGAYQIYNLTISTRRLRLFSIGETKLSFSIKNLLDEEYVEPGYNGIDIPGHRRTICISVGQMF